MAVNGAKISFRWKNGLVTELHSDKPITVWNRNLSKDLISDEKVVIKG